MTNTPATPEDEGMKPDEILEWRDLQDAQMTALQHVWDNPDDECWNEEALPVAKANGSGAGNQGEAPRTSRK